MASCCWHHARQVWATLKIICMLFLGINSLWSVVSWVNWIYLMLLLPLAFVDFGSCTTMWPHIHLVTLVGIHVASGLMLFILDASWMRCMRQIAVLSCRSCIIIRYLMSVIALKNIFCPFTSMLQVNNLVFFITTRCVVRVLFLNNIVTVSRIDVLVLIIVVGASNSDWTLI